MRKILLSIILMVVISSEAYPQQGRQGIGIMVGEPTGLNFKSWTGSTTAFDVGLAWSFVNPAAFHVHADFLYHNFDILSVQGNGKLPLYYGIGGRVKLAEDTRLGVRVPLGIAYMFANDDFDIFLELVPTLDLVSKTDFNIMGNLGFRYYFR